MTLSEWVNGRGHGEIARIAKLAQLAYNTVLHLAQNPPKRAATYHTAAVISAATEGAVTVDELMNPSGVAPTPARRRKSGKTREGS